MAIYNLDDHRYLAIDIDSVIKRLSRQFIIQKIDGRIAITSNIRLEDKTYWASQESTDSFNFNIPEIKSLHNDMYRLVENLFKVLYPEQAKKFRGVLENRYEVFKHFRILNNKFKHYLNDGEYDEIALIQLVEINLERTNQRVGLMCQFKKGKDLILYNYTDFVKFFYSFLFDNKLISLEE